MTWEQTTIFQQPIYKIDKPIRLIELFAGVGSQAMALRNIGADFEHWKVVEFDKYPVKSYNAIHGTDFEATDICNIHGADLEITDTDKYCYIITYSFPCQDLSVAGKGKGMSKGSGTRSGLLWEVERLIDELDIDEKSELPQVLLMENVPQVHGKKNIDDFNAWLGFLKSKGYSNHWADLNAKNYGIAQNRNRCFCVSILGDYDYKFPEEIPLTTVMADYLDDEVDEKYYINSDRANELIQKLIDDGTMGGQHDRCKCQESLNGLKSPTPLEQKNEESVIEGKRVTVYANYKTVDKRNVKIARTILARDYKGFGSSRETSNAVCAWRLVGR